MKSIILIAALFGSTALASQGEVIYAPNYTCAELQQIVANTSGQIGIQGRFGFATYANSPSACYAGQTVGNGTVFGTKDTNTCNVGYSCAPAYAGGGN